MFEVRWEHRSWRYGSGVNPVYWRAMMLDRHGLFYYVYLYEFENDTGVVT